MSNIQPYIIINGVNSRTISGLLITSLPPISKPQQRTQVETVDGRSGDIITPLGFSAYDKTVSIGLTYNYDIDEVIEFFNTSGTVIFSNEPTKYYRFAIYEQIDFEKLIKFKTAEVVLHVQPYKFSTTEEPLLFNDPTEISVENNGNTDARPNLLITGSGEIDVSLNGSQLLSIDLGEDDQAVIIDSENMNAYGAQSAIREVVADIEPKQAGSGDPSPDNVREIIGYSELNLTRCGKNFTDISDDTISGAGYVIGGFPVAINADNVVLPSGNYVFSFAVQNATYPCACQLIWYRNGVEVGNTVVTINSSGINSIAFTASGEFDSFVMFCNSSSGGAFTNFNLNIGSTATEYEAYNGSIYTIAFTDGDNPLTVYGGKLNVTTGELTITWGAVDLGTFNYNKNTSNIGGRYRFTTQTQLSNAKAPATNNTPPNALIDRYKPYGRDSAWANDIDDIFSFDNGYVNIYDSAFNGSTPEAFKGAMDGVILAYELATPTVYQLTPTQINNLLGLNNLYSDTGDLSVKYKSGGVIQTQTGDIVTFTVGVGDMDKGTLLNRLITGDYDKIRLKKGENVISFTGNVKQVSIDKYSRWI